MPSATKPGGKPSTVADALAKATHYWETNERRQSRGVNMMPLRAARCADILGRSRKLRSLDAGDGADLLVGLRKGGLARSTVGSYYAAGRRMLSLSGVHTEGWPKAPTPERRVKEPTTDGQIADLLDRLEAEGWNDTADLVRFMRDTGARVDVEALNGDLSCDGRRLLIRGGKGGHDRVVPYSGNTPPQRGLTYEGHLRRIKATGSPVRPHDLRRAFVKRAFEGSGNNIRVAQALAGHSDPGTTAGYIGVSFDEMERALA